MQFIPIVLAGLTILLSPVRGGKAASHPRKFNVSSYATAAKFVNSVKLGSTLAQIKRLVPLGTRISRPEWFEGDQAVGNVAKLSGTIHGVLIFKSKEQQMLEIQGYHNLTDHQRKFHANDPIVQVQIYLNGGASAQVSERERIVRLSKYFGKPKDHQYVKPDYPSVHGWHTTWMLRGRRQLDYWQVWYGHSHILILGNRPH